MLPLKLKAGKTIEHDAKDDSFGNDNEDKHVDDCLPSV